MSPGTQAPREREGRAREGRAREGAGDAGRGDASPGEASPGAVAQPPGRRRPVVDEPVLPVSRDRSDEGWGDAEDGNDERLRREVPPHW